MTSPDHERVRRLFHEAVELTGDEQDKFLQRKCGNDEAVRQEVSRLLKHHEPERLLLEAETKGQRPSPLPVLSPPKTKQFGDTMAEDLASSAVGMLERHSRAPEKTRRERRLLVLASIAVLVTLCVAGGWVYRAIQNAVADSLERTMQALLDEQVYAVETWLETEERLVSTWARAPDVVTAVTALHEVAVSTAEINVALREAEAASELSVAVRRATGAPDSYQYAVWNREGTLLADSSEKHSDFLGNGTTEYGAGLLSRVFRGETVLWLPTRAGFITEKFELRGPVTKAGIALITPIPGIDGRPMAAMLISSEELQHRLESLLQKARFGETGEAYAFADDGFLITESRFMDHLRSIRLIDDKPDAYSAQIVRVADPGGNLVDGYQPKSEQHQWPLTLAAQAAVAGYSGSNFNGYRDYRGVMVVGVWTWLPDYRFGIATEVDFDHAYSPLSPLTRAFSVIVGALVVAVVIAVTMSVALLRLRNQSEIGRVGAYTLKSLIGEGGFAHVYLASHALLKRPTAVKVLKQDQMNAKNLARFEREVQLASSLTHPNTIGIYDYGLAADGRFYYAMEFIKGLTLQELIDLDGPQKPERIAWILTQICRSLREAHSKGLIHRDIKPQNIMLCKRGGEHDTIKVLDFGLARNLDCSDSHRVTETQLLIGTPLYIAPERIVDPTCMDPRSDIYSLGVLGFYLLTGREPFEAANSMDALAQTISRNARRPSEQSPGPIPEDLDRLIRDCYSRTITDRPTSIDVVLERLDGITFAEPWSSVRAAAWWTRHKANVTATMERVASVQSEQTTTTLVRPAKARK